MSINYLLMVFMFTNGFHVNDIYTLFNRILILEAIAGHLMTNER